MVHLAQLFLVTRAEVCNSCTPTHIVGQLVRSVGKIADQIWEKNICRKLVHLPLCVACEISRNDNVYKTEI